MNSECRLKLAIAVVTVSTAVAHAELRKSYFAATKPSAWAKYAASDGGPPTMEYTYRRLPDENGGPRIEFAMEFKTGEAKGKRFLYGYRFKRGFPIEKDALSYGRWTSRMTLQQGTGKPQETPSSQLAATVTTMADYGAIAAYVDSGFSTAGNAITTPPSGHPREGRGGSNRTISGLMKRCPSAWSRATW